MLTLANTMRLSLLFACISILIPSIANSEVPRGTSRAALNPENVDLTWCIEATTNACTTPTDFQQPAFPASDDSSPLQAEDRSHSEMFAAHKGTERVRRAKVTGLNAPIELVFDSSILASKTRKDRSALRPIVVAPIRLTAPTREVRGEPVVL